MIFFFTKIQVIETALSKRNYKKESQLQTVIMSVKTIGLADILS